MPGSRVSSEAELKLFECPELIRKFPTAPRLTMSGNEDQTKKALKRLLCARTVRRKKARANIISIGDMQSENPEFPDDAHPGPPPILAVMT